MNFIFRLLLGLLTFWFSPYSHCGRCYRTWNICERHSTGYGFSADFKKADGSTYVSFGTGIFALCEDCWAELTPKQRLPYYKKVVDGWNKELPYASWNDIKLAVLAGR